MATAPANVVQSTLADLLFLARDMREDDWEQARALHGDMTPDELAARLMVKAGPKFTLLDAEGKPIIAGGYEPVADGVMQSWMLGTMDGWKLHWREITKASLWMMEALLESGVRRLQTTVLASRTLTCRWYTKSLRMQPEGVWRRYGRGGEDVAIFARVSEN